MGVVVIALLSNCKRSNFNCYDIWLMLVSCFEDLLKSDEFLHTHNWISTSMTTTRLSSSRQPLQYYIKAKNDKFIEFMLFSKSSKLLTNISHIS